MRRPVLALCAAFSLCATVAGAQVLPVSQPAPLSVGAGQATYIALSAPVRDVVVSDPNVADVSVVNDRTLVVLGKKTGSATLMAFDAHGRPLANRQVVVSDQGVIVQRGVTASTYACGDRCSPLVPDAAPISK